MSGPSPSVQGATVPPSFSTELVQCMPPRGRTEPYIRCTKIRFTPEWTTWPGEPACAFLVPYTWCTRSYGTSQFQYRACTAFASLWLYRAVQRVYENAICTRLDHIAWLTGMCVFKTVHRPSVQRAMRSSSFSTDLLWCPPPWGRTEKYIRCTKIRFTPDCTRWPGEPACAFPEPYT